MGRHEVRRVLVRRGAFGFWWWRRSLVGIGVEMFGHLPRRSEYAAKCAAERRCSPGPTPPFAVH